MMLSATSASSCDLTASFQWWDTVIGLCMAIGLQWSKNEMENGSPVMICKFWLVHVLNALLAKWYLVLFSSSSWYSGMTECDNVSSTGGQGDWVGQPHGANMSSVAFWLFFVAAISLLGCTGKLFLISLHVFNVVCEMYKPLNKCRLSLNKFCHLAKKWGQAHLKCYQQNVFTNHI